MLQKGRRHDADAAACNETARTSRGQAPLTHYTGQQTSVHSVPSVVKNDATDLPRSVYYNGGVGDVDLFVDYDRGLFFGWRLFEERVVV